MEDLSDLGEEGIIELFNSGRFSTPIVKGIGDDCAVIGSFKGKLLLWTIDLLVERIHFNRAFGTPRQLGAKSLAVNLSDIAAMGGEPISALIGLSLPSNLKKQWLMQFREGLQECADRYHCQIVGGDTCGSSEDILISITVIGQVEKNEILMRSGPSAGDDIWISGFPGLSAFGLEILQGGGFGDESLKSKAIARHLEPTPMISLGRALASGNLATSCIDTSDGIALDLNRICKINNVGALIDEQEIPLPDVSLKQEPHWMELALHGGEDYQLLFTAAPAVSSKLARLGNLSRIGTITTGKTGVKIKRLDGSITDLSAKGYSHF